MKRSDAATIKCRRAGVSGTVTLDGAPLTEGIIRFVPIDDTQGPKASVPIQHGQLEVDAKFAPLWGRTGSRFNRPTTADSQ